MEPFVDILAVGGKTNSLGRADEVIKLVLDNPSRLDELYACITAEDAWIRMRAIDSIEKICRVHSDWLQPYLVNMLDELTTSNQPSIQWHLAQIFTELDLSAAQKEQAVVWLTKLIASTDVDWIVSANSMQSLVYFEGQDLISKTELRRLLQIQQIHKSNAVKKRASKYLQQLESDGITN